MKLNVPNSVTFLRVIFGGLMVWSAYAHSFAVVVFYLLALATDLLDGFLARKLKQETEFGAKFDAITDNFIVVCVVLSLYLFGIYVLEKYIYQAIFLVSYYLLVQALSYYHTKEPVFMRNYAALAAAVVFPVLVLVSLVFESKLLLWLYGILTAYSLTEKLFLKVGRSAHRSVFLVKSLKTKIYFAAIVLLIVGALYILPVNDTEVCIDDTCYPAEIRNTPPGRQLGLMYRNDFEGAMLFVFEEPGRYGFWMKNMRFPIDIIFLDEGMEIVDTFENVPPCYEEPCPLYTPSSDAKYVVEIKSE